jgi:hypothetical protein
MLMELRLASTGLVFALLGSPLVAACTKLVCTQELHAGLSVTVADAIGAPVCDAVVTAREGTFSQQLMRGAGCIYSGAYERTGTYSVEVVARSTSKTVPNLVVTADECHVNTLAVTIMIDADNASDGGANAGDASAD